ncbi:MAG: hypothetical protein ACPGUV_10715, partial [Polyangiales bacterium]
MWLTGCDAAQSVAHRRADASKGADKLNCVALGHALPRRRGSQHPNPVVQRPWHLASPPLYIIGDIQGAWPVLLGVLAAAELLRVEAPNDAWTSAIDSTASRRTLAVRDVLLLDAHTAPKPLRLTWTRDRPVTVVQLGDFIHGELPNAGAHKTPNTREPFASDSVHTVALARRLQTLAKDADSELEFLLGNHEYSFLTSPSIKPFPTLVTHYGGSFDEQGKAQDTPQDTGAREQICQELYASDDFAGFLLQRPLVW